MITRMVYILIRYFFYMFWIFPIKRNRIIFTAYKGAQFSCNPKYIFLELYNNKNDFEFIWCLNNPEQLPPELKGVKIVKYKSLKYIYYQLTSNIVILNHANPIYIPLRKKQLKINTWHGGGAYKKVRLAANGKDYNYDKYKSLKEIKDTDYFISSCSEFTSVMSESLLIPRSSYFEIGMPRNDLFFKETNGLKNKIKNELDIQSDVKIILYAPTYRGKQFSTELDFRLDVKKIIEALKIRFGDKNKWKFLLRTHLDTINVSKYEETVKDVSSYSDMQELLLISDVLITDYSSSIWDFALTNKPAFLFTPDLNDYVENRGLYLPIEKWQYPYAENMEYLINNILQYDSEESKEKIKKHLQDLGSYENGNASKKVSEIIQNHITKRFA